MRELSVAEQRYKAVLAVIADGKSGSALLFVAGARDKEAVKITG
jgi:hypothetical protein